MNCCKPKTACRCYFGTIALCGRACPPCKANHVPVGTSMTLPLPTFHAMPDSRFNFSQCRSKRKAETPNAFASSIGFDFLATYLTREPAFWRAETELGHFLPVKIKAIIFFQLQFSQHGFSDPAEFHLECGRDSRNVTHNLWREKQAKISNFFTVKC